MTLTTFSTSKEAQQAAALLDGYRFELGGHEAPQWVSLWLESYRPAWIRDAVVEALYQGRYKSVSVRQILELWQRKGQPVRHVTHDFEAAVCREFGGAKLIPTKVNKAPLGTLQPAQSSYREPALQRASRRTHQSLSSISFNLADQPPTNAISSAIAADPPYKSSSPAVGPAETAETLRTHRQLNGILFPSARAIQPFKPALPFSAQTLRLAKQKAMAEARR